MSTRLALSSIAFSISLLACGSPADSVDPGDPAAPDAGVVADPPDAQPEPAPFEVAAATTKLPILAGESATLDVTVTRHASFTGDVTISLANLPAHVSAAPVTIAAGATTATLTIRADGAPHSLPTTIEIIGASAPYRATNTATVTIYGPPGSVDTSFQGGKLVIPVGAGDEYAYATAIQADGKVLLAGRAAESGGVFAIARLTRDGALDTTFGGTGKILTEIGFGATIHGLAVQPDGKIVAVGSTASLSNGTGLDFAVVRYLPDGTLDTTFSGDGRTIVAIGTDSDTAYAVALQPDGKIVVGGDSNRGSSLTGIDFALVRLDADGSPDATFGGGDGIVTTALATGGARDSIYALALQTIASETRIVAVGGEGDFAIARYRPDGSLDTTLAGIGKITGMFGSVIGTARAVQITPQGELVVAGHINHDFALVKLSQSGQVDPMIGRKITKVSTTNWDEAQALVLDGDKILIAGWVYDGLSSSGNFALVRYDADGTVDQTFAGGIVITPVASNTKPDQAMAMALQVDDRVPTVRAVVAGFASASNSDFAVARYWR